MAAQELHPDGAAGGTLALRGCRRTMVIGDGLPGAAT